MKRSLLILPALTIIWVSVGLSGGNDLRVISEKADIYAEPNSQSYLIETVQRGTSLSLFQKGKIRKNWYYIVFFSDKRKGRVSGFIQEAKVVAASDYEDIVKSTPLPIIEEAPTPAAQERIGAIPLKLGDGFRLPTILPLDAMDSPVFKRISEVSVDLGKKRGYTDLSFPEVGKTAFLEVQEHPVEIRTQNLSIQDAAPTQEIVPFGSKEESLPSQMREELIETPLPAGLTESGQGFEDAKGISNKTNVLSQAAPSREETIFLRLMNSPQELETREMPVFDQPPVQEIHVFEVRGEMPEEREELSATPLFLRPVKLDEMGLSEMQDVSFREVVEVPVELTVGPRTVMTDFPERQEVAFQKNFELPVELSSASAFDLTDFPPPEIRKFQTLEVLVIEELSMTPLLEIDGIRSHGYTEEGNNGNGLPLLTFSTENAAVFQIITEPPVEIAAETAPPLSPQPELIGTAYQKPRKAAQKTIKVSIPDSEKSEPIRTDISSEPKLKKPETEQTQETIRPKPILVQQRKEIKGFRWFTLGLGYGQSLGGMGGFLQFNTKSGISIHGGVGYYPSTYIYAPHDWVKNVILFNGGIKYYLPLKAEPIHVYLDLQYGGIGVEAAQIITGIWQYTFVFENKQKVLWGPSILTGVELRFGHVGLNGALGFSYNLTKLDWSIQQYFFTFDLGLLLLF